MITTLRLSHQTTPRLTEYPYREGSTQWTAASSVSGPILGRLSPDRDNNTHRSWWYLEKIPIEKYQFSSLTVTRVKRLLFTVWAQFLNNQETVKDDVFLSVAQAIRVLPTGVEPMTFRLVLPRNVSKGAFFWGYSGYSYSGLGITEYTEFQFRKERSYMFQIRSGNGIGGALRTGRAA